MGQPLLITIAWGIVVGVAAAAVAILPAFHLARQRDPIRRALLLAGLVGTACVPAYLTFWIWGYLAQPGSPLADLLRDSPDRARLFEYGRIALSMTLWTWPMSALCLALSLTPALRALDSLMRLDGAGPLRRVILPLRTAWPGAILAFLLPFAVTIISYDVFDLALIPTVGNEIRRLFFETHDPSAVLVAGSPLILVGLCGAAAIAILLQRALPALSSAPDSMVAPAGPGVRGLTIVLLALGLAVPLGIAVSRVSIDAFMTLGRLEAEAIGRSLLLAAATGATLAALALDYSADSASSWAGWRQRAVGLGWIACALAPAALVGSLIIAAYNTEMLAPIYRSPVPLWLGHTARYAFLPLLLIGVWRSIEPREARWSRRLDGANTVCARVIAGGPALWGVLSAAAMVGAAFSLGEVSMSVVLSPAGFQTVGERTLNKMHYAREESALATTLLLITVIFNLSAGACLILAACFRQRSARPAVPIIALAAVFGLGCDGRTSESSYVFEPNHVVGATGRLDGRFVYPRAITVDEEGGRFWVVDKSGRIQQFSRDGAFQRSLALPKFDKGYPSGLTYNPADGLLYVADTHNHRIVAFNEEGRVVISFGSWGLEPGRMIYPTSVAFGDDGRIYVAEYGGNDRVQIFSADHQFLASFNGTEGGADAETFNRPQQLRFDAKRRELWIADACNHRLVVTDPQGRILRTMGSVGTEPGSLAYPYDLVVLEDGSVLVAEYGNNRIQHLNPDGSSRRIYGSVGDEPGFLQYPWGVSTAWGELLILDSGNDRVQITPLRR